MIFTLIFFAFMAWLGWNSYVPSKKKFKLK